MKEEIVFLNNKAKNYKLFMHLYLAERNDTVCIFLNPILDEKKRVQRFQIDLSREMSKRNNTVVRFDYYATGDSEGEVYQFSFENIMSDINFIIDYSKRRFRIKLITLLGIRLGADLAMKISDIRNDIQKLILIEPILDGKRYLLEQRTRRKAFFRLNNITNPIEFYKFKEKSYEDFQGFLIQFEVVAYIAELNSIASITNKSDGDIYILSNSSAKKQMLTNNKVLQKNNVLFSLEKHSDFWSSLEMTDTTNLVRKVLNLLT